jgi:hypothetical protein
VLVDMLLVRVLLGKLLAVMLDHNQQRNRLHHQWLLFNLLMLLQQMLVDQLGKLVKGYKPGQPYFLIYGFIHCIVRRVMSYLSRP